MKKKITPATVLLAVLIVVLCFFGFGLFRLKQAVTSLVNNFSIPAQSEGITTDNRLFDLYAGIYTNLEEYGVADKYGAQTADLANLMFDKTFKNCEVTNVVYQDNGFLVTIEGDGIPLSQFSPVLWTSAAARAAGSFLSNHFFDAAAALFQGEDAIKAMLFKDFGEDVFDAVDKEIDSQTIQHVTYTYSILHGEDGQWQIQLVNEAVSPVTSSQNTPAAQSSQDASANGENSTTTTQTDTQEAGA